MSKPTLETVLLDVDDRGVATITLNRPEVHNALNGDVIDDLRKVAAWINSQDNLRVAILTGTGKSFCSGGDFNWFSGNLTKSRTERVEGSAELAYMLHDLDTLKIPLVGRINGPAYGGGVGMISVCDISIAADTARFGLTEVRVGLLPANISPYVVARMGQRNARRTFLSGALFSADKAVTYELLNEAVPADELDTAIEAELKELLMAAPGAVADTKRLIRYVAGHNIQDNMTYTADRLADAWEKEEGITGINCFIEKRNPPWREG
jgi:methylglutaconyl-CoA hydratase